MSMVFWVFILVGLVYYGFQRGWQRNNEVTQTTIRALEEALQPEDTSYVRIGGTVGYGFEFQGVVGFEMVRGLLTLLPRQAPLYMPLAKLAAREDRLQLTFFCSDIPQGVGTLVRTKLDRDGWAFIEGSEEMRREDVSDHGEHFRIYAYNPQFGERLKTIVPSVVDIPSFQQLSLDHRKHSISAVLKPDTPNLKKDLQNFAHLLSFLTTSEFGFTV